MKVRNEIWGWDIVIPLTLGCAFLGFGLYWFGISIGWAFTLTIILYYGIAIKYDQ